MSRIAVGDVCERMESSFEWRIPNWNSHQVECVYHSPSFQILDASWNVEVIHRWWGHVWFYVVRNKKVENRQVVTIKLRARTGDGNEYKITKDKFEFTDEANKFSCVFNEGNFLTNNFTFDDNLTVSCTVYVYCSVTNTSAHSIWSKCPLGSETCIEGSEKEAEKNDGIIKDATLSKPTDIDKLVRDLKNLLTSEKDSDVTLKVKNREFRAHKNILRTRSSVFDSMFDHDMAEKNCGIVDISDCDPEAFQYFLTYLYSASVDNFSDDIVFNLYFIADKYDTEDLKHKCVEFMVSNLSVDTFCDVVALALQHEESTLLETATDFFIKNTKEVLVSVQWQAFYKENPVTANELYIKSFDYNIIHK